MGDANCDGAVSLVDYVIWRGEFIGSCTAAATESCGLDEDKDGSLMDSDFNQDGTVTIADYTLWMNAYLSR